MKVQLLRDYYKNKLINHLLNIFSLMTQKDVQLSDENIIFAILNYNKGVKNSKKLLDLLVFIFKHYKHNKNEILAKLKVFMIRNQSKNKYLFGHYETEDQIICILLKLYEFKPHPNELIYFLINEKVNKIIKLKAVKFYSKHISDPKTMINNIFNQLYEKSNKLDLYKLFKENKIKCSMLENLIISKEEAFNYFLLKFLRKLFKYKQLLIADYLEELLLLNNSYLMESLQFKNMPNFVNVAQSCYKFLRLIGESEIVFKDFLFESMI
ncbi:hypothetical protein NUSPORA_02828 [Nucleospora cyclopteri]